MDESNESKSGESENLVHLDDEQKEDLTINHFALLPNELKVHVFSYLPFKDILKVRLACQDWSKCTYPAGTLLTIRKIEMSDEDGITAKLHITDHGIKNVSLDCLCELGGDLLVTTEKLKISLLDPPSNRTWKRILKRFTNLRSISVSNAEFGTIYDHLYALVGNNAKTLEKFSFIQHGYEKNFDYFEFDCKMLAECSALSTVTIDIPDYLSFKNLEHLPRQISFLDLGIFQEIEIITWIGENFENLKFLKLQVYHDHKDDVEEVKYDDENDEVEEDEDGEVGEDNDEEPTSSKTLITDDLKKLLEMPKLKQLEIELLNYDSGADECPEAEEYVNFCNTIEGVKARRHFNRRNCSCYLTITRNNL